MPLPFATSSRFGPLGVGVASLFASLAGSAAQADPLTISDARTTAVSTATAANGAAGDVSVTSNGSIIVADTGPALTVNSSNAVTNDGSIQSSAVSGATAVLVDGTGGITTTIATTGAIGVTGTGGSGNYGIRVVNGSITGSIASSSTSSLSVTGDSAVGLSIEAPFTGNVSANSVTVSGSNAIGVSVAAPLSGALTLTGSSSALGANAADLRVTGAIGGGIINNGSLTSGQSATTGTDSSGNAVTIPAAAGIAVADIAASVGGGFLNNRYYVDTTGAIVADAAATSTDTLVTSSITGIVGTTGVLIAPVAANGTDIRLSAVGAAGSDDGYGFVNRGAIGSSGTNSGTADIAVRIAGASLAGVSSKVFVDQGLINQANGRITASATDAIATGIDIGAGASVPAIVNRGSLLANGSAIAATANATTAAQAILIEAGGQVGSITNSGTIAASVSGGTGSSVAILDQAGSLATISNSGTISSLVGTSGAGARAIDLSAGSSAVIVSNSGSITGDILFGSGNATYSAASGSLTGAIAFGRGTNRLSLAGTSAFDNAVTLATGGTLAVDLGGSSSLNLGTAPPVLASLSATGQSQLALSVGASGSALVVTGAASFTDQSSIKLVVTQQAGTAPVTVLSAGGGITTDHLATLIGSTSAPFLYTVSGYAIDGNALKVTLHQKNAAEAGFGAGIAPLFDQSLVAFGNGATFQTIANLPSQAALFAAYRQITPPSFGTLPVRLAQNLQSAGAGVIRGRLDALAAAPPVDTTEALGLTPWIEENVSLLRHGDSPDDPGFRSNVFDVSVGADYALAKALTIGAAGTFAWDDVHIDGMSAVSNKPFSVNSLMADVYAGWHQGPFFAQIVGGYAHNRYDFHRQIDISSISVAQTARWNGYQVSGDLVGGMRFRFGRLSLEPSDALSYVRLHQSGYTTSGGGDLDLAVEGKSDKAATNTARMALGYRLPVGEEAAIDLALRAGYVVQLDKHVSPLVASYTAGGGPFELTTVAFHGNSFQEGASVAYEMAGFYVGLTGDRRQENQYSDTSLALTLRTAF